MKAVLIYHQKAWFQGLYLMEMTIHEVGPSERYPDGIKYGLLCLDIKTGCRVLMDNHHPKGHHMHLNEAELPYEYQNDDRLIEGFKMFVLEHMGVRI
jgi:hypothetical protein